jgi:hypothetical protein
MVDNLPYNLRGQCFVYVFVTQTVVFNNLGKIYRF